MGLWVLLVWLVQTEYKMTKGIHAEIKITSIIYWNIADLVVTYGLRLLCGVTVFTIKDE